jgi:hypothetical protein
VVVCAFSFAMRLRNSCPSNPARELFLQDYGKAKVQVTESDSMRPRHLSFAVRLRHMELTHNLDHLNYLDKPISILKRTLFVNSLSKLLTSHDGSLRLFISSQKRPLFYSSGNSKLAVLIRSHIRLGRTKLAASFYRRNMSHSANCTHCHDEYETVFHVLFDCPRFDDIRQTCFDQLVKTFGITTAREIWNFNAVIGDSLPANTHWNTVTAIFDTLLTSIHCVRPFF